MGARQFNTKPPIHYRASFSSVALATSLNRMVQARITVWNLRYLAHWFDVSPGFLVDPEKGGDAELISSFHSSSMAEKHGVQTVYIFLDQSNPEKQSSFYFLG